MPTDSQHRPRAGDRLTVAGVEFEFVELLYGTGWKQVSFTGNYGQGHMVGRDMRYALDRIAQTEGALRHIADFCKPAGIGGNHVRMGAKKARQIAKEALDG